jgi:cation transport ATPase
MSSEVTRTLLLIAGMRDNGCRERVAEALEKVTGVKNVHVNLYRARAEIIHDSQSHTTDFITAVTGEGYGAELPTQTGTQAIKTARPVPAVKRTGKEPDS